ncbi:MAG: tRNA 2-thiouridine(34) synthase MnmA [Candidatus Aminicenantes bacterium]|nr:tRNA 2-thiouridine(34) synthase MnmA [Candidatus Aminicenantes bacterium]
MKESNWADYMNKKKKVLVAMSGGIDSSVAAALLKQKGFEVVGVYMKFLPDQSRMIEHQSARKSKEAADCIGIEHFTVDLREKFSTCIIDYLVKEYSVGLTPNPCVKCNARMKFEALLEEKQKIGADLIATGHYARIHKNPKTNEVCLKRGVDPLKDQSYFLYLLSQRHLSQAVMPLGDMTKQKVGQEAQNQNLPLTDQKESQEICFVPDNDYIRFIKKRTARGFKKGPIKDQKGNVLGTHQGYARFTVGQRRGLGIAASHPLYVLDIDPINNAVYVGPEQELYKDTLIASRVNWVSATSVIDSLKVKAQIRYNHTAQDAVVILRSEEWICVKFDRAQRAVTPGQSVVFYKGDVLLGGATIMRK